MIIEYHRPETMADALALLARKTPVTLPLGGGTILNRQGGADIAVVDLQSLGLADLIVEGQALRIGAMTRLEQLYKTDIWPAEIQSALVDSLDHEAGQNVRQQATLGGSVVGCNGRSTFVTALLALDLHLQWAGDNEHQALGDYLPLREEFVRGRLLLEARLPLNARLRFAAVSRSPMDQPVVCAAVATWPSGRTRVALGGFGKMPILAMDGPEPGGASAAAREAMRYAEDEWASAAYRMETAATLARRLTLLSRAEEPA